MPLALTVKKKRTVRFQGLAEFKWSDLGEQDVVGQGSFGAVFMDFESRWLLQLLLLLLKVARNISYGTSLLYCYIFYIIDNI